MQNLATHKELAIENLGNAGMHREVGIQRRGPLVGDVQSSGDAVAPCEMPCAPKDIIEKAKAAMENM